MAPLKSTVRLTLYALIFVPLYAVLVIFIALYVRLRHRPSSKLRFVFGSTPIANNIYWSKAVRELGCSSETFVDGFYSVLHSRSDWDRVIGEEYRLVPNRLKVFWAFASSLLRYDVYVISFDGFFIGRKPILWRLQSHIWKLSGKKVVVIPYGGDFFVYGKIRSPQLAHGLNMSYPAASRDQDTIDSRVKYWRRYADCVIPCSFGFDGLGRWDVLVHSTLAIDLDVWRYSTRRNKSNGTDGGTVVICHAPNHRGFKGTEFVIAAVDELKVRGFSVRLVLVEGVKNADLRRVLETEVDIVVEQLIYTGYSLNGIEAMASGLPVVDNLEDESYLLPFRRWSYFNECPVVSATPENLADVLSALVSRPELRTKLGKASRRYVEKYHGLECAQYLFENILDYLYGRKESLINLYHPLLGAYTNRSPKVRHPLMNNRIVSK
jgi:glycosyltransferase involved in cell wall biosynthesis